MTVRMIGDSKVEVTNLCTLCNHHATVVVDAVGYELWRQGTLIQNALPDTSPQEREILLTGTHPACWDEMFGDEED